MKLEALKAPQKRLQTAAGEVEILPASDSAGAASSYDLAIIDELGLLGEKHREFVASMRSSVSAKGGRFLALTIHGAGPYRAGNPSAYAGPAFGVSVHHYHRAARLQRSLTRRRGRAANPGLGSIKSVDYMESESARAKATPSDQALFRSNDLNAPGAPSRLNDCHARPVGRVCRFAATAARGQLHNRPRSRRQFFDDRCLRSTGRKAGGLNPTAPFPALLICWRGACSMVLAIVT